MGGTRLGGQKAAKTNIRKHGADFYKNIGRMGGVAHKNFPSGFAAQPRDRRVACGKNGGAYSRRGMIGLGRTQQGDTLIQIYTTVIRDRCSFIVYKGSEKDADHSLLGLSTADSELIGNYILCLHNRKMTWTYNGRRLMGEIDKLRNKTPAAVTKLYFKWIDEIELKKMRKA